MYENIRNKYCKWIKEMSDNELLLFCVYFALMDTEALESIVDLEKIKANADKVEADLEEGEEDVI